PGASLYPQGPIDALTAVFTRCQKAAFVVNGFKLTAAETAYLTGPHKSQDQKDLAGLDLNALPLARDASDSTQLQTLDSNAVVLFQMWVRLNDFVSLRGRLPQGDVSLIDVFSASSWDEARLKLTQATGWDTAAVDTLAGGG